MCADLAVAANDATNRHGWYARSAWIAYRPRPLIFYRIADIVAARDDVLHIVVGAVRHTACSQRAHMSLCAACGSQLPEDERLCRHHHSSHGDQWAEGNRIMCDFLHRKKVLVRLAPSERDDDFWACSDDAA
jgi:hypothetical protein